MADTKVSGLAGAASFNPATTQEFPINDAGTSHKVSAAQIAAYFPNGTQGGTWYAQVTANQGPFTTLTALTGLTVTPTIGTARRIKVTGSCLIASTVAQDLPRLQIMEGATVLQTVQAGCPTTANETVALLAIVILTPTAGAHTYSLSATREQGTGNLTMNAAPTLPAFILVEDIGT